jgi:hypothetical protein
VVFGADADEYGVSLESELMLSMMFCDVNVRVGSSCLQLLIIMSDGWSNIVLLMVIYKNDNGSTVLCFNSTNTIQITTTAGFFASESNKIINQHRTLCSIGSYREAPNIEAHLHHARSETTRKDRGPSVV